MGLGTPVRLGAAALIELSEQASRLSSAEWSVAVLSTGYPEAEIAEILALPVGTRDRCLLAFRQLHRSRPIQSEPNCRECGVTFELSLQPDDIGFSSLPVAVPGFRDVEIGGKTCSLRPVTLDDLLAVERIADPDTAAQTLGARVGVQARNLPVELLSSTLEAIDPAADIWLKTHCPECGEAQSFAFDSVHFLAQELRQIAQGILRDVVEIARVFHWSEKEILALPETRRAYYVAEALA